MSEEIKKEENKEEIKNELPTFSKHNKIINQIKYDKLILREFKHINCDGAAILESFQGQTVGLATMCGEFIIEDQKLPLIGDIISKSFPPMTVIKKGQASQGCRIYGNKDFVVFTSSYQFGPEVSNEIVEILYDFAQRHQSSIIITIKGIQGDPNNEEKEKKKKKPKVKNLYQIQKKNY
jgi:predicted ATP-grasp superfamily ATP-dependent carboligase